MSKCVPLIKSFSTIFYFNFFSSERSCLDRNKFELNLKSFDSF
jgi:hypothetical protein